MARKRSQTKRPKAARKPTSTGKLPTGLRASPRAAFEHHVYTLFASLGRLARTPVASLMTVGVIAIALALPAAFFISLKAAGDVSVGWSSVGDISVFLEYGATERDANALLDRVNARSDIAEARLVDPAAGLDEFDRHSDMGEAVAALDYNPLPWVLELRPADDAPAAAQQLAMELERDSVVNEARVDMQWLNRYNAAVAVGQRAVQLIGALLAVGVLLIVGNTIRLDIENRREEIEVTKMLGGSDGFVRRPFLYAGFWYGVGGGLLAILIVGIGLALLGTAVDELLSSYSASYRFAGLDLASAARLLGAAGLIGWLGSWLAVSRHLAAINPR